MILADTSIVIDFVRSNDPKLRQIIANEPAAICGIVRAEVLQGTRDPGHRQQLTIALNMFGQLPIPDLLWDTIGDNLSELRRRGVTVPLADGAIASVAIANDIELWTRDNHFQLMQQFLPTLRLFQEPP